jgi:hypothetical protein
MNNLHNAFYGEKFILYKNLILSSKVKVIIYQYGTKLHLLDKFRVHLHWIRDSVVGIMTSYEVDHRGIGIRVPIGSRIFSTSFRLALWST